MIPHLPLEDIRVPCLVPESEIRAFVSNLRNRETYTIMSKLLIIAFATIELMQDKIEGEPDPEILLLIKQMARENDNKRYSHMMREIVSTLDSGKAGEEWMKGLRSVCMTISRAIEYTERLLPDPQTARKIYEGKLEEVRQASRTEKKQ